MKTNQASFMVHDPPAVLKCGNALDDSLALIPLIDRRPAEEIKGKKPKGVFLLVWNQRIGDYVTSNKSFLEPHQEGMADRLAAAISRTNCFYEVKTVNAKLPNQPTPDDFLPVLAEEKVRYVLVGEIQHFYGKQHQKAYYLLIPALWVNLFFGNNRVDTAVGKTEILFTLYDAKTGSEVWRSNIQSEKSSAMAGSYPQMAMQSFAEVSEKLANQLYDVAQSRQ